MDKTKKTPSKLFDIIGELLADGVDFDKWNEASQAERDAMVTPLMRVIANRYTTDWRKLFAIMEDENYHTERRILMSILGIEDNEN